MEHFSGLGTLDGFFELRGVYYSMFDKEIRNVILEYLKNPKAEYAVMIDGDWGSGKTYFLTHSLLDIMADIDLGKDKRRKYAYVSLYGVKTIEEISREIVFQYFGKKNKKKVETSNVIMETASNVLTASLGAININLSSLKDTLAKVNINNWIICFDDLERCCLPINETLGYINRLVEHCQCKVIILANEKEIGKANLNHRLEEKYKVILSGKNIDFSDDESSKKDGLSIEELKKDVKELFSEDMVYSSIREKVVGLTIRYEPKIEEAYDSIIKDYNTAGNFIQYLEEKKGKILGYFADEECINLRTLIAVIGSIQKVYDEMNNNKYDTIGYYDRIMDEFLKYIVQFTIYYRNGGKVGELKLTTEIGYVSLGHNIFHHTRGFKFLEKYCTTLNFIEDEFLNVVSSLRKEYAQEEEELKKSKTGKSYGDLAYWWELEDEQVNLLISELKEEIRCDKYAFHSYQGIIADLIILEYNGFEVGDYNEWVSMMNQNIERSEEPVDIEKFGYSFKNHPDLLKKYNEYVDRLKLQVGTQNRNIKIAEIMPLFDKDNWTEEVKKYCEDHYNEICCRYGFIDLIDMGILQEKIKTASVKELYEIKDIFKTVYRVSNINQIFMNDKEKIEQICDFVAKLDIKGINRPKARETLLEYLNDIIKRLENIL